MESKQESSSGVEVRLLSRDESIMLYTLAVVGTTYPHSSDSIANVEHEVEALSAIINGFNAVDHPDFHVNADYLGHALRLYGQLLQTKLGWTIKLGGTRP
ncbi:hypothetical protein B484DRAFT_409746, partial [Ochromonadaceae sp. CCMP2298]